MGRSIDLSLYLVIGADDTRGRPIANVVLEAVRGGVTAVQLREKHAATRAFVEQARALVVALRPLGVPLIINDRVDVAIASGADGVHVGQDDMCAADARRLIGPDRILGLSVTTLAEANAIDPSIVDYAGVGPVFATPTKLDAAQPLGLPGASDVCRALTLPIVAIGGINHRNAGDARAAGAHGVAVVSAVCSADDPMDAARRLVVAMRTRAVELTA
jgi:thiamine-phosphate pyrophosphorylase